MNRDMGQGYIYRRRYIQWLNDRQGDDENEIFVGLLVFMVCLLAQYDVLTPSLPPYSERDRLDSQFWLCFWKFMYLEARNKLLSLIT